MHRWYWTRVGLLVGTTAIFGGLAAAAATAWLDRAPIHFSGHFANQDAFNASGVAPIFLAVFAVALGVAVGATVRRTLAAVGLAMVLASIGYGVSSVLQNSYATPRYAVVDAQGSWDTGPDDRIVGVEFRSPDGRLRNEVCTQAEADAATTVGTSGWHACAVRKGYQELVAFHSESQYWRFQWIQAGTLTLAAGASLTAGWLVLRRRR